MAKPFIRVKDVDFVLLEKRYEIKLPPYSPTGGMVYGKVVLKPALHKIHMVDLKLIQRSKLNCTLLLDLVFTFCY